MRCFTPGFCWCLVEVVLATAKQQPTNPAAMTCLHCWSPTLCPLVHAGVKVAVLLADSHASRNAFKMAKALTCAERDMLHLITCVASEEFRWGPASQGLRSAPDVMVCCADSMMRGVICMPTAATRACHHVPWATQLRLECKRRSCTLATWCINA